MIGRSSPETLSFRLGLRCGAAVAAGSRKRWPFRHGGLEGKSAAEHGTSLRARPTEPWRRGPQIWVEMITN